jgi:hypothetical protein
MVELAVMTLEVPAILPAIIWGHEKGPVFTGLFHQDE